MQGLSVVDASIIIPLAPGTHLDATVCVVAEKVSLIGDIVLRRG